MDLTEASLTEANLTEASRQHACVVRTRPDRYQSTATPIPTVVIPTKVGTQATIK